MIESRTTCKNCAHTFVGHYCNNCGQDAHTGKIDVHFLSHELQHGLLHVDKGFVFTLKELFTRPGIALRDFIEGKRVRYFKPLSFLLVLAGVYTFIYHFFGGFVFVVVSSQDTNANNAIRQVNEWSESHYAVLILLQLPLLSYVCYLFFKRYGTNYLEQLVINMYLSGQRIAMRLALLPLLHFLSHSSFEVVSLVIDILVPVSLFSWSYRQFYANLPGSEILWKAVLVYTINYVLNIILISILLTVLASF